MAAGTSFKQQCPSCEAMVPIRDPGLIGRKIDCPKCKYRFVVEEPARDEDEDEAPAKKKPDGKGAKAGAAKAGGPRRRGADDDDKPAKKKAGGSNMLIIGGGLGLAAVVAVVIGAVVLMSSDDGAKSSGGGGGSSPPPGGMAAMPGPAAGSADPGQEKKPANQVLINVSNLLPNDAQAVIAYPLANTLGSSLKAAAITQAEGGFRPDRFRQTMGVELDDVHRVVNALNSRDGWVFTVLQARKPINADALKAQLALKPLPQVKGKSGKTHELFQTQNEMDSLSNLLVKCNLPRESLQVHFYDSNTVVFADPKPMKSFLEADGKPEYLTREAGSAAPAPTAGGAPGMSGPPMAGGMPGMMGPPMAGGAPAMTSAPMVGGAPGMAGPPMAGGAPMVGGAPGMAGPPMAGGAPQIGGPPPGMMMPGMPGMGGSPTPAPAAPEASVPASWMTVDPSLKTMLDRIEKLEENKNTRRKEPVSLVTIVGLMEPLQAPLMAEFSKQLVEQDVDFLKRMVAQQLINTELKRIRTVGASLVAFDQRRADVSCAVEYTDRKDAERVDKQLQPLLPMAIPMVKAALGLEIKVAAPPANTGNPGGMMAPGFPGMAGPPGGFPMGEGGGGRPGRGGMAPITAPGVSAGPGGGGMPPASFVSPPGMMPGAGMAGGLPGVPGNPGNQPPTDEKDEGTIKLVREDRLLVFSLDLNLSSEAYNKLYEPAQVAVMWVKSQSDLASTRSRVHELAGALQAYVQEKGQFPPGAMPRSPSAERGLPWRPDQRLSWAVALLPYLGEEFRDWRIDPEAAWNEGKNSPIAMRIIPALVAHRIPEAGSVQVAYPNQPNMPFGATHYVGMAGVGLDAPEYRMGDAATEKKIGIFGYDRTIKKADIKDGLDRTIALIMVPGDHKAPWLAGGGATVRAVSEEADDPRPIAPFVCCIFPGKPGEKTKWDGKKGTLAIMADGKVRFVPEDLPAATFRALCTIAGGEDVGKIDQLCPLIEEPARREITTQVPVPSRAGTPTPAAPSAPQTAAPAGWKEFTSATGKYKVLFPDGAPQTQTLPVAGQQIEVTRLVSADGKSVGVTWQDIPAQAAAIDIDTLTKQTVDGLLKSVPGAKLGQEGKGTFEGTPDRTFTVSSPQVVMSNRLIRVGNRMYLLTFATAPAAIDAAGTKTFFESFKVVK
ncbi:MAG: DUF1559 domain-containing protein [Gemmataceae bacterium]